MWALKNSHFLDLSTVYGSTDCVAKELRRFSGGELLQYTANGFDLPVQSLNVTNLIVSLENMSNTYK